MTIPTNPYIYIPNTLAQSAQVNASFNGIYGWANGGIDDTNLNHLVGIYASTITATTANQGKFGTNPASTVGFQFIAPAANVTPLTVSGTSGQSADIFGVDLTSGGTQALFVNSVGATVFGNVGGAALPNGPSITGGAAGALLLNSTASQQIIFSSGSTGTTTLGQFATTGAFVVGSTANANAQALGDIAFGRAAAGAFMFWGQSSTTAGQMDFGESTSNAYSFRSNPTSPAYVALNASAFTVGSDRALKSNIKPIGYNLATLISLAPSKYTLNSTGENHLGFIAQDVQGTVPEAVSSDKAGTMLLNPLSILAVTVAAVQDMAAKLKSAGVSGF